MALFLCVQEPDKMLEAINAEWNNYATAGLDKKCELLGLDPGNLKIFNFPDELSDGIDARDFNQSHLVQPDLFLRIRPGYQERVLEKLQQSGWPYQFMPPATIRLATQVNIAQLLSVDQEVVIQDLNSQNTGNLLSEIDHEGKRISVWDCCAASGGKSILANDLFGKIELTVSDIRKSVLHNLEQRFKLAGINSYRSIQADLTTTGNRATIGHPDFIIADVPCTGSGTWGRNPERLCYFKKDEIAVYVARQQAILTNLLPHLKKGATLLYITCSVFKKENEEMVAFIRSRSPLQLQRMELLSGYDKKADTLFAALLKA